MNDKPIRSAGRFVLYWMIAARRSTSNFALDRAMDWAVELRLPLVVLEALRCDYPHASDRLHRFVIDGMRDNEAAFAGSRVLYYPYVEPWPGAGKGLLERLSDETALIVTDDFPCFFLPQAVAAAGERVAVRLEAVDSNGLLPLRAVPRTYPAAVHFRRFMQGALREHLASIPCERPLARELPAPVAALTRDVVERWPRADSALLNGSPAAMAALPIDHAVGAVSTRGGARAGATALRRFVGERLGFYVESHSHPDDQGTSRLSPYLHFGHLSCHDVFSAVMRAENWNLGKLGVRATGGREGWWGVGPSAEAFLDQLVVWRELALNTCFHRPSDYDRYESLPTWALATLEEHRCDPRPWTYDQGTLESAETHDPLWNAAQAEMTGEGWMHNYMRMLWGKKILEWSETPGDALATMIRLMNRWCLDGRDPNSYAGYMWILGRYDRPWPERPIFGTVRYMSSESALRKLRTKKYLGRQQPTLFGK